MTDAFRIRRAGPEPGIAEALADVLVDCVDGGASIGFMHPVQHERAVAFVRNALESAARGERIVLVAEEPESRSIVGTVQVVLAMPDNQPHRADVAKMQVHRRARRRGLGAALMRAAVTPSVYARLGWQRCGVIPSYALAPRGGLCGTTVFYRELLPPILTITRPPFGAGAAVSSMKIFQIFHLPGGQAPWLGRTEASPRVSGSRALDFRF